jgi:hypothetical protein
MNYNTLKLNSVIMHRVPEKTKGNGAPTGPELSDIPSPHDDETQFFFRRKLTAAFGYQSFSIEEVEKAKLCGVVAARKILADPDTALIPQSQALAKSLFDRQDKRNPAGILVVALGEIDSKPCICILKLEHERGVRAERKGKKGQQTFQIQLLKDLLLTDKTRLFKAAIIRVEQDSSVKASACDNQVHRIADFFLVDFLGCRLRDNPAVATERFFEATESFINTISDSETRARYEIALLADVRSGVPTISPSKFAEEHFAAPDRQLFFDHLEKAGIGSQAFHKDTELVEGRVKRIGLAFESGTKLVVPPEAYGDQVKVEKGSDSKAKVTINDKVVGSHGRGR